MKVYSSTLSDNLAEVYADFEDTFGFGPCGAYAALKRDEGWGDVAVCIADGTFTHYVLVDGGIIDLANPFDEPLTYTDLEILDADEMPELCWDGEAIEWLRARGV